jgi:hypothetical protein
MLDQLLGEMVRARLDAAAELRRVAVAACEKHFHRFGSFSYFSWPGEHVRQAVSGTCRSSGRLRVAKDVMQPTGRC